MSTDTNIARRLAMVATLRNRYGVRDERILAALEKIPRDSFIPPEARGYVDAYGDHPCPIGYGQTISQPFIVAHMTELLEIQPGEKALEIGGGCGYQAAVLAELGLDVFSLEIIAELAKHARQILDKLGYDRVRIINRNGRNGLPEEAPFKVILIACAALAIPPVLLDQLDDGGRLVAPVGANTQRLILVRHENGAFTTHEDIGVRFVPMV